MNEIIVFIYVSESRVQWLRRRAQAKKVNQGAVQAEPEIKAKKV